MRKTSATRNNRRRRGIIKVSNNFFCALHIIAFALCVIALWCIFAPEDDFEMPETKIHMMDTSFMTPGFMKFMEQDKNGTFKDLEPVRKPESMEEEEISEEEDDEIVETENNDEKTSSKFLKEVELLAQVIYAEEGVFLWKYNSNPAMVERVFKLAGSVIINRAETGYLGAKNIHDVLYAKGQYDSRTKKKVEEGQDVPEIVYTWAEELLTSGTIGPKNLVYQSEWPQGEHFEQIGNQYFGCLK